MLAMTVDAVLGRNERDGGTPSRRGTRCLTLERRELMGPKCPRTRERGRLQRSRMVACGGHLLGSRGICTASRVVKPRERVPDPGSTGSTGLAGELEACAQECKIPIGAIIDNLSRGLVSCCEQQTRYKVEKKAEEVCTMVLILAACRSYIST